MKTLNIYLNLLLLVIPFLIVAQPSLSRVNPLPQENTINDMVKIPGTNKMIAVCDGSTYMISEDMGNSWQIHTNPAGKGNRYNCISVFFCNQSTGFIAGSDESILKTVNGGLDWTEVFLNTNTPPWLLKDFNDINFKNPSVGVAVGPGGNIVFTDTGGDSWDTAFIFEEFDLYAADYCGNDKVFAVGDNHLMIYVSHDDGETWETQIISPSIPGGTLKDILFINSSIGFITVNHGYSSKILRTENSGETWEEAWTGNGFSPNKIVFADQTNGAISCGQNMYKSGMLKTFNGGLTWYEYSIDEFSWFANNAIIMSDNYEVLMGGYMGMIFKSILGGQNWDKKSERTFWGNVFDVQFTDLQTAYALASNHSGGMAVHDLMKTTNGGLSWNPVLTGESYAEAAFCFVDNELGYYANRDVSTKIYKTENGGADWDLLNTDNFDFMPFCIQFYDESLGLICGTNNIIRTEDGGTTWELVYPGFFTDDHWDIHFKSENEILVCGSIMLYQTTLIRSHDGGNTWESETLGEYGYAYDIEFINSDTGFMACDSNVILKTVDGGEEWFATTVSLEDNPQIVKIQFPSSEIGYASGRGSNSSFFMTTDLGENWETIESPSTSGIFNFHFFTEEMGLAFGENGIVLKTGEFLQWNPPVNFTLNTGYECPNTIYYLDWEEPDLSNTPNLVGYNIYRNDTLLLSTGPNTLDYTESLNPFDDWPEFICYHVSAVYENPSGESVPTEELCDGWLTGIGQNKDNEININCYPNPFINGTKILFSTNKQKGELTIFDQTGKQIHTYQINKNMERLEIPGDDLKPGIYFYQLKTDDGISETKKMIKH